MTEISDKLKKFLQINKELLQDGKILELYKESHGWSIPGEFTDLLLDSGVNIWEYFGEEIPARAFASSTIKNLKIPDTVKSIGVDAFRFCDNLTSITISDSVTSIKYGTFGDCINLTSITIPNRVTSIGFYAFAYCSSLTSVTIPNSVTYIGNGAFKDCSSLTTITYEGTMEQWDKIKKVSYWNYNSALKTVKCVDGDINL